MDKLKETPWVLEKGGYKFLINNAENERMVRLERWVKTPEGRLGWDRRDEVLEQLLNDGGDDVSVSDISLLLEEEEELKRARTVLDGPGKLGYEREEEARREGQNKNPHTPFFPFSPSQMQYEEDYKKIRNLLKE
jgi:hypothetical protein